MWAASCTTCKAAGVSTRDRPARPTWDGGGPVVRTTTWKRSARPAFHHNYHSYKTDSEATIAAVTLQLAHSFELLDIASLGEHCHRKAYDIDPKHRTLSDEQDQFSRKKSRGPDIIIWVCPTGVAPLLSFPAHLMAKSASPACAGGRWSISCRLLETGSMWPFSQKKRGRTQRLNILSVEASSSKYIRIILQDLEPSAKACA